MPLDSSISQEQAILYQARGLAPAERGAFLKEACGQDQELRQRIEARLKAEAIQLPLKKSEPVAGPGGTLVVGNGPGEAHPSKGSREEQRAGLSALRPERFLPGARIADR
jgi:hypothetical protein